jgi:D-alanine-D-alanine ligase
MKVLVLHSRPPKAASPGRTADEFDLNEAASNVAAVLEEALVCGVRGDAREVLALLDRHRPDVVFNLCEAPLGRPDREAHVAALLEWLGMRFTGSGSETLALCRRKDLTNAVLQDFGVPVPARVDAARPVFPCIVKPAGEDGSAGLHHDSVCDNAEALARAVAQLEGPAVIQEFLAGREFAVSLWGREFPEFASIGETVFLHGLRLITYAGKWDLESADFADTPIYYDSAIAPDLRAAILSAARGAWLAVGARHTMRVDVRLDAAGRPCVLDVNPNPEMGPGVGICRAVQEADWRWQDFVSSLLEWA